MLSGRWLDASGLPAPLLGVSEEPLLELKTVARAITDSPHRDASIDPSRLDYPTHQTGSADTAAFQDGGTWEEY